MKNIRGTPRQLVTDSAWAQARIRRISEWTDWCQGQGFDTAEATAAHFLSFLEQLGTRRSSNTLKTYRYEIAQLYEDPTITHNPQSQALIDAAPSGAERQMRRDALKQEAEDEVQLILEAEARLMEPHDSHLSIEKRKRIARARAHANVTDNTMQRYVRYAWIPFKEWCQTHGTSPERVTPGDVSSFLCEIADAKNPTYASATLDGLLHVFSRIRPSDNPADAASVRKTLRGLQRERPSPPRQATPIGAEELTTLINNAHNPRYRETREQARLRAAVDIALLCTMHDTGIRGSEAADAVWDDLDDAPDGRGGSILRIPRSKTDQLHEGAVQYLTKFTTDAINHMKDVRRELGIVDGDPRIFRLSTGSIERRIKAACKKAGLTGRYTTHSTRVGTAQDLVTENFSDAQIMHLHRWRNTASVAHYTKKAKATKNAVAQREQRRKRDGNTPKPRPDNYGIRMPYSKAKLGH